jgi:hypothetical protein
VSKAAKTSEKSTKKSTKSTKKSTTKSITIPTKKLTKKSIQKSIQKSINRQSQFRARAFAPATVANVAVGFDIMGFALEGLGEVATVERIPLADQASPVIIGPIKGFPEIVTDPEKNTAGAGLLQIDSGPEVEIWVQGSVG